MLRQMVVDLGVGNIILFLDYIPKDDQIELMKGSVAIIQPTLFEGGPGGGSIYDAVSLGVRAIASNIPINHELPLSPKSLLLFEKQDPKDLLAKMKQFLEQHYEHPSAENLYQQSKQNTQLLSKRLYEAIDYSIAGERN
jgi:glycosyltransferase involved in cell wall biosynthesis